MDAIKHIREKHPDVHSNKAAYKRAKNILKRIKKNIIGFTAVEYQVMYDAQVIFPLYFKFWSLR